MSEFSRESGAADLLDDGPAGARRRPVRFELVGAFAGAAACALLVIGVMGVPESDDVVATKDGQRHLGRVVRVDPDSVEMRNSADETRVFSMDDVASIHGKGWGSRATKRRSPSRAGGGVRFRMVVAGVLLDSDTITSYRNRLEDPGSPEAASTLGPGTRSRVAAGTASFLGHLGTKDAIRAVAPLLGHADDLAVRAAEGSLEMLLRRHPGPRSHALLAGILGVRRIGELATARAVAVVAKVGDPAGWQLMMQLLGRNREIDLAVVPSLARHLDTMASHEGQDEIAAHALRLCGSSDAELRRDACLLVGRLKRLDAVPELIRLLDDPIQPVRDHALWALREATGLELPGDSVRWKRWHGEEEAWKENRSRAVLAALGAREAAKVAMALREVGAHPSIRDVAEEKLGALVFDGRSALRAAACHAIGRLRCLKGTALLRAALEDDDPRVRQAASEALALIEPKKAVADDDDAGGF